MFDSELDLWFIRHAESIGNLQLNVIGGRFNSVELSTKGHLQANLLGNSFLDEGVKFDRIISSKAVRACQTTNEIINVIGGDLNDVFFSDQILELDQGDREGAQRDKIYTPETIAIIIQDHWNFKAPNGESQREVETRMLRFIYEEIIEKIPPGKRQLVAVVSHALAIKCALRGILGSDASMTHKIDIDNTSITRLKFDNRGWHLGCINDTAHLTGIGQ